MICLQQIQKKFFIKNKELTGWHETHTGLLYTEIALNFSSFTISQVMDENNVMISSVTISSAAFSF